MCFMTTTVSTEVAVDISGFDSQAISLNVSTAMSKHLDYAEIKIECVCCVAVVVVSSFTLQ
jgi:hypothetical protein